MSTSTSIYLIYMFSHIYCTAILKVVVLDSSYIQNGMLSFRKENIIGFGIFIEIGESQGETPSVQCGI